MNPYKRTKICKFNFWKVTCGFHMCQNVISNMMFEIKRPGTQDFGTRHGQGYIFQHCNLETPLKYYNTKSGRYWIGLSSLHLTIQIPWGPSIYTTPRVLTEVSGLIPSCFSNFTLLVKYQSCLSKLTSHFLVRPPCSLEGCQIEDVIYGSLVNFWPEK